MACHLHTLLFASIIALFITSVIGLRLRLYEHRGRGGSELADGVRRGAPTHEVWSAARFFILLHLPRESGSEQAVQAAVGRGNGKEGGIPEADAVALQILEHNV
jgi:hypothetical protein